MCNGTVALEIAIRALGLSGEVIVPSFSFVATAHALAWQEITPIFCDVDPHTHNLDPDRTYPPALFTTATRDDRVHPGHARKMVARMRELGLDVLYYENTEGGHGGSANNEQRAYNSALVFEFLWRHLTPQDDG